MHVYNRDPMERLSGFFFLLFDQMLMGFFFKRIFTWLYTCLTGQLVKRLMQFQVEDFQKEEKEKRRNLELAVRISFVSLVKNCNHKGLGIYYLLSAFIFGISGTLISVLIRIELKSNRKPELL